MDTVIVVIGAPLEDLKHLFGIDPPGKNLSVESCGVTLIDDT